MQAYLSVLTLTQDLQKYKNYAFEKYENVLVEFDRPKGKYAHTWFELDKMVNANFTQERNGEKNITLFTILHHLNHQVKEKKHQCLCRNSQALKTNCFVINAVFVGQRSSVRISNKQCCQILGNYSILGKFYRKFGEIFKLLGIFQGNFALSIRQHWTNKNHHFVANAELVAFEHPIEIVSPTRRML